MQLVTLGSVAIAIAAHALTGVPLLWPETVAALLLAIAPPLIFAGATRRRPAHAPLASFLAVGYTLGGCVGLAMLRVMHDITYVGPGNLRAEGIPRLTARPGRR